MASKYLFPAVGLRHFEVSLDGTTHVFGHSEWCVLTVLADYANEETDRAWPSHQTIARRCQLSKRTVIRAIAMLVALELISISPPTETRPSNTYTLNFDAIATLSAWQSKTGTYPAPITTTGGAEVRAAAPELPFDVAVDDES